MKVLLINSDIAKNRGDRAIAEGLIQLIYKKYPAAEITGISEMSERDGNWYGIEFLDSDVYTLNPLKWIKLLMTAYSSDVIFWGGGEYLKDYTNKASLWYWLLKVMLLRIVNPRIYGAFQGIGPTRAKSSKWIIATIVGMTKKFLVRDEESYNKLIEWGVDHKKLVSSSDPAIFPQVERSALADVNLYEKYGISKLDLEDFITIAPRNWFHYKKGRFIPQRFRSAFKLKDTQTEENIQYINSLVNLIDYTADHARKVFLVPMHMGEDVEFCKMLKEHCAAKNIRVLSDDRLPPEQVRRFLGRAKMMIGFRLHSNIIATSNYTPSINYYYVDKGRAYFNQIDQAEYCFPIEALLTEDFMDSFKQTFNRLLLSLEKNSSQLEMQIDAIRKKLVSALEHI